MLMQSKDKLAMIIDGCVYIETGAMMRDGRPMKAMEATVKPRSPNTARPRPPGIVGACVLFAALTALGLGCDANERVASCPSCPIGMISGYVIGGKGPVSGEVTARSIYLSDPRVEVSAQIDSTGWYELSLPLGNYLLRAETNRPGRTVFYYRACGPVWSRSEADTLTLDGVQLRADFACGGVAIAINIPGVSDGERFRAGLTEIGGSSPEQRACRSVESANEALAFRWDAVVPGAYAIYFQPTWCHRIWLPGSFELEAAETLLVQSGKTTSSAPSFGPTAHLAGEVRGSWQLMEFVEHPIVAVFSENSLNIAATSVDDEGGFVLNLFVPVPVRLHVSIEGLGRWIGADSFSEATVFEPEAGGTLIVDPYVEGGILCSFSGPGDETNHNAMILLIDAGGNPITPPGFSPFVVNPIPIPNLAPGTYYLHVERARNTQRWLPQWYDQADSLQDATAIEVLAGGEVTEVTVGLIGGGTIQGRVLKSDAAPFGYRRVRVYPASDSTDAYTWARTGETTGAFSAVGLPDGAYKVGLLYGRGGARWWYPGTRTWGAAEIISIEDHSKVTGIEWCLPEQARSGMQ